MSISTVAIEDPTTTSTEELISIVFGWQRQLRQSARRVAIVAEDAEWSYQQLESLVDTIARRLIDAGIGPQDRVGLCVDRSVEAIASMLAVFKINAIFVPLDPEYPVDRLAFMVEDAQIEVIIGHRQYLSSIGAPILSGGSNVAGEQSVALAHESVQAASVGTHACREWINCEELLDGHPDAASETLSWATVAGSDLAYIMYTSGSTGKPKGVQIDHRALATYCDADIDVYQLTADDRTLQFSTLCFDIAIEEIFPPLLTGGCVVIRPRERSEDRNELSAIVDRFGVTAIHLATAYWHQWVDLMVATSASVPESIRLMIVTGEKVSVEHYRRWQAICNQEVLWCNAYGPTEATVSATVFIPDDSFDAANMPIGKPLKHYEAYVLDDQFRSLPPGETGSLFLGGPALAAGYLNRPELTETAFLNANVDGVARRIYRTGDLARWMPDGNIDFAGRVDHQIKLGSYRIEPGEIEAAIDGAAGVEGSLVSFDEVDGKKFLVAYVAHGANSIHVDELVQHLRAELPAYMVPTRYVLLESFPKTINGKIDRRALPPAHTGTVPGSDDYVAPRTDLERRLVEIWQEVLNLPRMGIHDDFFAFGGSSLLVVQVIARLTTELDIELPVRDFFANPTIAASAAHLEHLLQGEKNPAGENAIAREARSRLPIINPGFFASGNERLLGIHYHPQSNAIGKSVVFAHSIGHEYTRAYANLQTLATQLCRRGFDVLRFDYASTGNSSGACDTLTAEGMLGNLVDAIDYLRTRTGNHMTSIVGLRLGATVASQLASVGLEKLVLWDPVLSGADLLQLHERFHARELSGLTRYNMNRRSTIDQLCGHRMGPDKRNSLESLRLQHSDAPTVVVLSEGTCQLPGEQDWLAKQPNVHRVNDSIFWEEHRYITSAFASRNSTQRIIEQLCQGLV